MAARVCPSCDINYPQFFSNVCRWCGSPTEYQPYEDVDPDWAREPELAIHNTIAGFERLLERHAEFDVWISEHEEV